MSVFEWRIKGWDFFFFGGGGGGGGEDENISKTNIFSVQTIFFSGGIFVMSANNLFGCFAFAKKKKIRRDT